MKALSIPKTSIDLTPHLYHHPTYTLTSLLSPPLDDSPAALYTRNHAAVAKVAAPLPVNAIEADLAAKRIAARGQAEDMSRLARRTRTPGRSTSPKIICRGSSIRRLKT